MGGKALAVTEILPNTTFYDYEAKYAEGGSLHMLPAKISPPSPKRRCVSPSARMRRSAAGACSRTDFRFDDTTAKHRLILLEVNTQPGMTPTSLVPEQALHTGMSFPQARAAGSWRTRHAIGEGAAQTAPRRGRTARPPRDDAMRARRRSAVPGKRTKSRDDGVLRRFFAR